MNDIYKNNLGQEYVVLEKTEEKYANGYHLYLIRFVDTGTVLKRAMSDIKRGNIKDHYAKDILNVACKGSASYKGNERAYNVWHGMIRRCYDESFKYYNHYGGNGVNVCERWKCFEYFLEDIADIEGYDESLFSNGLLELDKDKKHLKQYSLDGCMFVSKKENLNITFDDKKKEIIVTNNETHEEFIIKGIREFIRNNGLDRRAVYRCLSGKSKTHKGFSFKYKN